MTFDPNDPRLTAYVLGELDPAECTEIEAMLETSAEGRQAVDEIRRTIAWLTDQFRDEQAVHALTAETNHRPLNIESVKWVAVDRPVRHRMPRRLAGLAALLLLGATFFLLSIKPLRLHYANYQPRAQKAANAAPRIVLADRERRLGELPGARTEGEKIAAVATPPSLEPSAPARARSGFGMGGAMGRMGASSAAVPPASATAVEQLVERDKLAASTEMAGSLERQSLREIQDRQNAAYNPSGLAVRKSKSLASAPQGPDSGQLGLVVRSPAGQAGQMMAPIAPAPMPAESKLAGGIAVASGGRPNNSAFGRGLQTGGMQPAQQVQAQQGNGQQGPGQQGQGPGQSQRVLSYYQVDQAQSQQGQAQQPGANNPNAPQSNAAQMRSNSADYAFRAPAPPTQNAAVNQVSGGEPAQVQHAPYSPQATVAGAQPGGDQNARANAHGAVDSFAIDPGKDVPAPPLALAEAEVFTPIVDNLFQATNKERLSTFSIDVDTAELCQRPPLSRPEPAPAQGCRPHRGTTQLLPLRRQAPAGLRPRPLRRPRRGRRLPLECRASPGADRDRGQAHRPVPTAAQQPRLLARRLRVDGRGAAHDPVGSVAARRAAQRERPGRDRRLRECLGIGAALEVVPAQGRDPLDHRATASRRFD